MICPIGCGHCCQASWRSVRKLEETFPVEFVNPHVVECPNLGVNGCILERDERPDSCKIFICDLGAAVEEGDLSLAWAWKYLGEYDNDPLELWNWYNSGEFRALLTKECLARLRGEVRT